mmetsp:Transcript_5070/g.10568  ORF Transcript_5070/g.10568 Transcript_5070/m.10568 type:complete len:174 (-) Transcript_5070:1099-1620(-)
MPTTSFSDIHSIPSETFHSISRPIDIDLFKIALIQVLIPMPNTTKRIHSPLHHFIQNNIRRHLQTPPRVLHTFPHLRIRSRHRTPNPRRQRRATPFSQHLQRQFRRRPPKKDLMFERYPRKGEVISFADDDELSFHELRVLEIGFRSVPAAVEAGEAFGSPFFGGGFGEDYGV